MPSICGVAEYLVKFYLSTNHIKSYIKAETNMVKIPDDVVIEEVSLMDDNNIYWLYRYLQNPSNIECLVGHLGKNKRGNVDYGKLKSEILRKLKS